MKLAVYICDTCQAATMIEQLDLMVAGDEDDVGGDPFEPLGVCAIVRDTHVSPHVQCAGTVSFKGFLALVTP